PIRGVAAPRMGPKMVDLPQIARPTVDRGKSEPLQGPKLTTISPAPRQGMRMSNQSRRNPLADPETVEPSQTVQPTLGRGKPDPPRGPNLPTTPRARGHPRRMSNQSRRNPRGGTRSSRRELRRPATTDARHEKGF